MNYKQVWLSHLALPGWIQHRNLSQNHNQIFQDSSNHSFLIMENHDSYDFYRCNPNVYWIMELLYPVFMAKSFRLRLNANMTNANSTCSTIPAVFPRTINRPEGKWDIFMSDFCLYFFFNLQEMQRHIQMKMISDTYWEGWVSSSLERTLFGEFTFHSLTGSLAQGLCTMM